MITDAYTVLAAHYDALQAEFNASEWADFYSRVWRRHGINVTSVLDLACGTGTLSYEFAARGYDVVASDISEDMLSIASAKAHECSNAPLFLWQSMEELNLYGTVSAVCCSLDGINYLKNEKALTKALKRVNLFLEPGGMFIFDILTPLHFKRIHNTSEVLESNNSYCVWQSFLRGSRCTRVLDIFERTNDGKYNRFTEEHVETVYEPEMLDRLLLETGFRCVRKYGGLKLRPPTNNDERIFFAAKK